MRAFCDYNKGFIKQLTVGKWYEVIHETNYGYIILDDENNYWEYSKARFGKLKLKL